MAGFLGISLLPNDPAYKWSKWGMYYLAVIRQPKLISCFDMLTVVMMVAVLVE